MNGVVSWCRHHLVSFIFHAVTSRHLIEMIYHLLNNRGVYTEDYDCHNSTKNILDQ